MKNPKPRLLEREIVKKVVYFTHGGNPEIIETDDFAAGVRYTIRWLRRKKHTKIPFI